MLEEGEPPSVVFDEQTHALIEGLVQSGVQAAIAVRVGDAPGTHATSASGAGAVTGCHIVSDPPCPTGAQAAAEHVGEGHARGGGTGREPEGGDSESDGDESRADSSSHSGGIAGDGEAAYQAFTARWYGVVAQTSRLVSTSPTAFTRDIRSDLKRSPWPTTEPFELRGS
jgi:hypothetical protein